jgi:hypothetical protein
MRKTCLSVLGLLIAVTVSAQEPKQTPTEKTKALSEKISLLEKKIAVDVTDPSFPKDELEKEKVQLKQLKAEQTKLNKVKTN